MPLHITAIFGVNDPLPTTSELAVVYLLVHHGIQKTKVKHDYACSATDERPSVLRIAQSFYLLLINFNKPKTKYMIYIAVARDPLSSDDSVYYGIVTLDQPTKRPSTAICWPLPPTKIVPSISITTQDTSDDNIDNAFLLILRRLSRMKVYRTPSSSHAILHADRQHSLPNQNPLSSLSDCNLTTVKICDCRPSRHTIKI